jgi:hypothetical protein
MPDADGRTSYLVADRSHPAVCEVQARACRNVLDNVVNCPVVSIDLFAESLCGKGGHTTADLSHGQVSSLPAARPSQ